MAIDIETVRFEIGMALGSIADLNVYDFPPLSAQPPFAFVDFPDEIDYDETFGRGFDRMTIRVFLAVANQVDEASADLLYGYCAGSGSSSVKTKIEAATVGTSVRVTKATFGILSLSSGAYAGVIFTVDVLA